jgi:outer membrane protein
LGTISLLPLSLTAKYYLGSETFRPYVGGGFNYTAFTDNTLSAPGAGSMDLRRSGFGGVMQAGFDYRLNERWLVSVDARKVWLDAQVDYEYSVNGMDDCLERVLKQYPDHTFAIISRTKGIR